MKRIKFLIAIAQRYKQRALKAEAAMQQVDTIVAAMQARIDDRAALISIVRDGRKIRFAFVRNNVLRTIETYGTWDQDVDAWKRALLEKGKENGKEG